MKTIISDNVISDIAGQVLAILEKKVDCVIALDPVPDLLGLFDILADKAKDAIIFSVTDRRDMLDLLLDNSSVKKDNIFYLTKDDFTDYDEMISAHGGLDIAILGLGVNARIGYNEIATQFESRTHAQKLTSRTRDELGADAAPTVGLTMGIKTITDARNIIVTAKGECKSDAVFKMLYARTDSTVPAAFLQIPLNVTVIIDKAASKKL